MLSIIFIHSSQQTGQYGNQDFAMKQGINYIVGFILMFAVARFDSDQILKLAWPLYGIGFASILLLKVMPNSIAPTILGAKRWFSIPLIGSIQPSEFFKISLLIVVASIAIKHNEMYFEHTVQSDLLLIGKIVLVSLPPSIFVYMQPDTGMVFLYLGGIVSIILLSGVKAKLMAWLTAVPLALGGSLIFIYLQYPYIIFQKLIPLLKPHQQERILGWLAPSQFSDQGYQTSQSLLAVGSGELIGKGIGNGTVYIPEKHTDFIFATVAEEGGFIIASIVICLFLLLIYRIISIAHSADTPFGAYICAGSAVMLSLQIFQNIGMIVGLMPVKGISLPFLTYGGSSLFSNMILIGIFLSIRKSYRKYMFSVD